MAPVSLIIICYDYNSWISKILFDDIFCKLYSLAEYMSLLEWISEYIQGSLKPSNEYLNIFVMLLESEYFRIWIYSLQIFVMPCTQPYDKPISTADMWIAIPDDDFVKRNFLQ